MPIKYIIVDLGTFKENISKSKKPADKKNSLQTEKAPTKIWFSFKGGELLVSPHIAFTFDDHGHFKGGRTSCSFAVSF